jgi:CelD/BcsL family acetyltransferase involved in cellulose biosynthesis
MGLAPQGAGSAWIIEMALALPARCVSGWDVSVPERAMSRSRQEARELALVTSFEGLERIEAGWKALEACSGPSWGIFQSFNFIWRWCRQFLDGESTKLAIVTGYRQGWLVMVWPTAIETRRGVRRAVFLGSPVAQYGDVLIDRSLPDWQTWLARGWDFLVEASCPDVVSLCKVRSDAALTPILARLGARESNVQTAFEVDLSNSANLTAFDERYPAKARKNRRRQRQRLMDMGSVELRRWPAGEGATAAVNRGIAMKRRWLEQHDKHSDALRNGKLIGFLAGLSEATVRPSGFRVSELLLDERPVACALSFVHKGREALYLITYDPAAEKASPGTLLIEDLLRSASF